MDSWIEKQIVHMVSQWDKAIENHYPEFSKWWSDPEENFRCINELWNSLDAIKLIDWDSYIKPNSQILDLGGGTGWLSAYLSRYNNIGKIYTLDSSKYFLDFMLPEIVKLMKGKEDKIFAIQGVFSPIMFEDNFLDIVISSSALHHSDNMENVLKEIHRVLKKDGLLFILNETPSKNWKYPLQITKQFCIIMKDNLFQKYQSTSQSISSSGYLYDPYLGDRLYPTWYWRKAICNSNFTLIKQMITPYYTRKDIKIGTKLTHFICQKI